jgi:peptide/nickel transport system substrate-binding protein
MQYSTWYLPGAAHRKVSGSFRTENLRMPTAALGSLTASCIALSFLSAASISHSGRNRQTSTPEEFLIARGEIGQYGGRLVVSERAEPKTLNPVTAIDGNSRDIIGMIMADLIHINRYSQRTEAALAKSWTVSSDGRQYTLRLRRGVRFSDGHPFDADDVIFTFQAYLDESVRSPQRELLVIAGKPIRLQKIDNLTVQFDLAQPYAAAERLFDSVAILPRHLLKKLYDEGKLSGAWTLSTPPEQIAGLGPFRLKQYIPGQRIILEPNPYYWKADEKGNRLPYFHAIVALFTPNGDTEAMRFQAGEIDVVNRLSAANFSALEKYQQSRGFRLYDLGPGLEYDFLVFNLNDFPPTKVSPITSKQAWFRHRAFRQAISSAIDREGIVRIAYLGRARPLWTHVTPGNKLWVNSTIPPGARDLARARQLLRGAGFSWNRDGHLIDAPNKRVEFSILHNAGNAQQTQIATLIQQDLKDIGIEVTLVPLEFRTALNRIFNTFEYDAAIMALSDGDADPNSEMNVWTSQGSTHVWNLTPKHIPTPWEKEIDNLMQQQMITLDFQRRKRMYDQVQQLVWENLPIICLISPDILVGAKEGIGNLRPAILSSYTLWNVDQLFFRGPRHSADN